MKKKIELKYPADRTVHWPSGPVNTCEAHGRALLALSTMLGSHIAITTLLDKNAECINCRNEKETKS